MLGLWGSVSGCEEEGGSRKEGKKGHAQRDVVLQRRARRVGGCGTRVGDAGRVGSACLRAKGRGRWWGAEGAGGAEAEHGAGREVEKWEEIAGGV
jgi:hypothetical protein